MELPATGEPMGGRNERSEGVAFAGRCRLAGELNGVGMEGGERMECSDNEMEVAPNGM